MFKTYSNNLYYFFIYIYIILLYWSLLNCDQLVFLCYLERETEICALTLQQQEAIQEQTALYRQFNQLNERESVLQKELAQKRDKEKELESIVFQLWQVPSLFVMAKFDTPDQASTDFSEGFS